MLTKCVNCGFYVRQDDEFCLNCGKQHPTKSVYEKISLISKIYPAFESNFFQLIVSLSLTFILVYSIASEFISRFPKFDNYILLVSLISWILIAFILFSLINRIKLPPLTNRKNPLPHIIRNKNNLISKGKIIDKRISEIHSRFQKIETVLNKIRENDSENLQKVRHTLLSAREIIVSQLVRYELQKQKIKLVRLQNTVSPYLFSLLALNEFEIANGLVVIENTNNEIYKIKANFKKNISVDNNVTGIIEENLPEKENFLAQLAETEISCEKLREALLSRQAVRALQDISPLEENLQLPSAREIVHAAESFNIQTTLTDFSESFDELEHEYKRLRAEEEVSQKLLDS